MTTNHPRVPFGQTAPKARYLCQSHQRIHWAITQTVGNMAKIEINWLEQWVMCITGPLCHQSYKVLLLQGWNYNNDPNLPSK